MFRRIVVATMIGALALTTGCGLHNPFTSKAEPVTYESVAQSELSPEEKRLLLKTYDYISYWFQVIVLI